MATVENEKAVKVLSELNSKGFNFSHQKIADWLCDNKKVKPNGIPYDRSDIGGRLRSETITDKNIIDAINEIKSRVDSGLKKVWNYHQTAGAPRKRKK